MVQRLAVKRQHFDREVYQVAQEVLNQRPKPTAAEIVRQLDDRLGSQFGDRLPTERTVAEWITKGVIALDDEDAPWAMTDAERPEDIAIVLDVCRDMRVDTGGSRWPSKAHAAWVVRLRRAYPEPDLTNAALYVLAFMARRGTERTVAEYLAHRPWVDDGASMRASPVWSVLLDILHSRVNSDETTKFSTKGNGQ